MPRSCRSPRRSKQRPWRLLLSKRRPKPLLEQSFHLPGQSSIDRPLVIGSAIFGLGWGLFGFCPGPAITSLGLAATGTLVFVPMMLIGIVAAALIRKRLGS